MNANAIKITGIVTNIYPMEEKEYNDKVFYSQVFNLKTNFDDKDRYVALKLSGNNIEKYAGVVSASYDNQSIITTTIDITSNRPSKYSNIACWKVEAGDTTMYQPTTNAGDGTIRGIVPTEPLNDEQEQHVTQESAPASIITGDSTLPF